MREKINALMSIMRQLADAGIGILAAAALTRSRDSKGRSSYDGKHLSLASFRESSELEYGCDDAFLLYPTEPDTDPDDPVRLMTLNHAKSRDGETKDVVLIPSAIPEFRGRRTLERDGENVTPFACRSCEGGMGEYELCETPDAIVPHQRRDQNQKSLLPLWRETPQGCRFKPRRLGLLNERWNLRAHDDTEAILLEADY